MRTAAETARRGALLAPGVLAAALALTRRGEPVDEWRVAALMVIAGAGVLLVVGVRPRRGAPLVASAAFLALAVWTAISISWAPVADAARDETLRCLAYAAAFTALAAAVRSIDDLGRVVEALGIALGAATVAATTRLIASPPATWFDYDRLSWPTGYPNTDAAVLLLAAWTLVGLAATARLRPLLRGAALAVAVIDLGLVALAESRGATFTLLLAVPIVLLVVPARARLLVPLGLAALALAAAALPLRDAFGTGASDELRRAVVVLVVAALVAGAAQTALARRDWRPRLPIGRGGLAGLVAGVALLLVAVAVAVDAPARLESTWDTFTSTTIYPYRGDEIRLTTVDSNRYDYWRVAVGDVRRHPLRGYGAAGFRPTYLEYGRVRERPRHAHDQTLDTAATLGLPGVALLWVAGVCGLGGLVVAARRAGPDGALAAAGFAAALGGVLHAHVERLWLAPVIGLPLAALLGAGAALLTRRG